MLWSWYGVELTSLLKLIFARIFRTILWGLQYQTCKSWFIHDGVFSAGLIPSYFNWKLSHLTSPVVDASIVLYRSFAELKGASALWGTIDAALKSIRVLIYCPAIWLRVYKNSASPNLTQLLKGVQSSCHGSSGSGGGELGGRNVLLMSQEIPICLSSSQTIISSE